MKKSLKSAIVVASLFIVSVASPVFAGQVPDCRDTEHTKYAQDSWNVVINNNNASDKSDIINALKVIGTGGFNANKLLSFDTETIYVHLIFDRSYYEDKNEGQKVLTNGLIKLVSLKGVVVECDALSTPLPGITVRN
jgi:hypothetical protein